MFISVIFPLTFAFFLFFVFIKVGKSSENSVPVKPEKLRQAKMIIASFVLAITALPAIAIFCGGKKGAGESKEKPKEDVYEDLAPGDKK
ncbi:Lipoprotein [Caenorhabditis elegans]|uniref:Lipoprotein n=1 Tax=Caenorhabditis elegans TaxID=6239 RepID=O44946_CAEEL|nr:Lipoprotein [Caenorhabditis elegans]CCD64890.1 Lipoprotein [Caenorhabditis elegans]|eukprot:NP_491916.2 Uncharacterized protein CELE_C17F3.1 [Caenorhabditis elegans]